MQKNRKVTIELDLDEALVLFEWSYRFMEINKLQFSCQAEPIVIDQIASELEMSLKEPFEDAYPQKLAEAQKSIASKILIATDPDDAKAYYSMGVAYEELNQNKLAIAAYKEAIALEPAGKNAARARRLIEGLSKQ